MQSIYKKIEFKDKLSKLKDGSYNIFYEEKKYLLSKQTLLNNKLIKLYAKELGGNNFISLNYYGVGDGLLKPCEMAETKVIDFVLNLKIDI